MNYRLKTAWTADEDSQLREMWRDGSTAGTIAAALGGRTRNAVLGRAHRLGIADRGSPIRAPARERPNRKRPNADPPLPKVHLPSFVAASYDHFHAPGAPCVRCGCRRDACTC